MLEIDIPIQEVFIEESSGGMFHTIKESKLKLEHSLVSISKWESRWEKPFLGNESKTPEQLLDYIKCMTIHKVDPLVYDVLTTEQINEIGEYIDAKMTATWFNQLDKNKPNKDIVTSEIIYYYMVALNIPFECEKWHLNRLLTLIRVCNEKSQPAKKMSKSEILARNKALNEQRKKELNTTG